MSDFIAAHLWPGAKVERSIFGTADPVEIWRAVQELCPEAEEAFHFEVSVGALVGLRLRDGSRVALKVHRGLKPSFLDAVQVVQRHLWEVGFPCPRPLGRRGRGTNRDAHDRATLEEWDDPEVRRTMAALLARLVAVTTPLGHVPGLRRVFFRPGTLWPIPHSALFDFEATAAGAERIDEVARVAKPICDRPVGRRVAGHGDWSAKHLRFDELRPVVVYDWDSLNTDREPVFVGIAAATFTYTEALEVALWPSADEAAAFLDDYDAARGASLTPDERAVAEAWATYTRAYAARCTHAVGKRVAYDELEAYADAFLGR
ncbi:MAG: hypothetical protein M3M94_06425 [Actinomycetota bacterium]|nr:hypothetical protein [Actinomycetota bacterium]